MKAIVLVGIVVAGCADEPGPGVIGSSADVMTQPGTFVGYRVVTECPQPYATFGVIGLGSTAVTTIDAVSAAGSQLFNELADVTSVWGGGGFGLGCEPGASTQIHLSSWRDVDGVIARTGEWLRTRDLALQVSIEVGSIPVPHAD